jgi:hypothetical protein
VPGLIDLAVARVPVACARELATLGLGDVATGQLAGIYRMDVTPDFVRALRSAGETSLTPDRVIGLRLRRP